MWRMNFKSLILQYEIKNNNDGNEFDHFRKSVPQMDITPLHPPSTCPGPWTFRTNHDAFNGSRGTFAHIPRTLIFVFSRGKNKLCDLSKTFHIVSQRVVAQCFYGSHWPAHWLTDMIGSGVQSIIKVPLSSWIGEACWNVICALYVYICSCYVLHLQLTWFNKGWSVYLWYHTENRVLLTVVSNYLSV